MEICVLGMESVKQADANASVAGKEIGASALQHQPSTVSIHRAKCAAEEARVCVEGVSAPIPGASAASVNTAPPVMRPARKTGIVCNALTLTICLRLYLISAKPHVLSRNNNSILREARGDKLLTVTPVAGCTLEQRLTSILIIV
ncbi:hypothetical protein P7K49_025257 [Saguinus oedipus]|uniref:Uncharacterized protein n=1 Tax=Saguinus oedipus TaxID=9490 RepID=A0ABQ9UGL7_SAGOE|nr:hypothetical protein P7K49_025257 [Saguinus oedipus]